MSSGAKLAFFGAILWMAFEVFARILVNNFATIHPVVLTVASQMAGAISLMLIAGRGPLAWETLRQPQTWAFGVTFVISVALELAVLTVITVTEMNALNRIGLLMSLIMVWMFIGRKPLKSDAVSSLPIVAGLGLIVYGFSTTQEYMALGGMVLIALITTFRSLLAELHPQGGKAQDLRSRCRVTGVTLGVSAMVFMVVFLGLALAKDSGGIPTTGLFELFPQVSDFTFAEPWYWGAVAGLFFTGPILYSYFYSTRLIGTEKVLMIYAFAPLFAMCWEFLANRVGLLDISAISLQDGIATALIIFGAVTMFSIRERAAKAKEKHEQ